MQPQSVATINGIGCKNPSGKKRSYVQLVLDLFSTLTVTPTKKAEKQKVTAFQKGVVTKIAENEHCYLSPITGCKITMEGVWLIYEDGQKPYKLSFSDEKEAYENFQYWCKTAEKDARKACEKENR